MEHADSKENETEKREGGTNSSFLYQTYCYSNGINLLMKAVPSRRKHKASPHGFWETHTIANNGKS
jgi:hypothetical protein